MAQGMLKTTGDTTTTQRTISNIIKNIDPNDVPCITMFGTRNENNFRLQSFPNHKYEWLEDTLRVRTDQLNGAINNSVTSVVVDDASKFKPGDVILIEDEKMWVSAVVTATNTLTVVRGRGGTTAASHADDIAVSYLFSARLEGADSDDQPFTAITNPFTYSQILHGEVEVSGSEQNATTRYGIPDSKKYQLMKLLGGAGGGNGRKGNAGDLMIDLEKTFFHGSKVQRTSSVAGEMGGADAFITTNVTAMAGAALDPVTLENSVQATWDEGGKPSVIVTNAWGHRKLSAFYAGSVRTERREDVGGIVITTVHTHFGDLDILLNRWCPNNKLYIVQKDLLGWITLRDWTLEPLAKTGDQEKEQVVGEFGFVLANEKAHAIISGFSTTN